MKVTASVLNVRSGPGTDFRVLSQLPRDASVTAQESRGDWLWVDPAKGWVHRAYVAEDRPSVLAPTGLTEIQQRFGLPGTAPCSAGRAVLPRPLKLSWSSAQITRFACHIELESILTQVFLDIQSQGLWSHLEDFGGCYNNRVIGGSQRKSTHAWGIAVDLNTRSNPMGSAGSMSPAVVRVFEDAGFTWGGRWSGSSRDPMHFQFASGY